MLIEAGAYINAQSSFGNTPLHQAIYKDRVAICSLLIQAGADIHLRNGKGETPLQQAKRIKGREALAKLLRNARSRRAIRLDFRPKVSNGMKTEQAFNPKESSAHNDISLLSGIENAPYLQIPKLASSSQQPRSKEAKSSNRTTIQTS